MTRNGTSASGIRGAPPDGRSPSRRQERWKSRGFRDGTVVARSDRDGVLGERVTLGETPATVVGVRGTRSSARGVYIRDFVARGGKPIEAPRLFLQAATTVDGRRLSFQSPVRVEFAALRGRLSSR